MPGELTPAALRTVFARLATVAQAGTALGLEPVAQAIVRQAKTNASAHGHHRRGTPTPARPGSGPAMISGTLVNSLGHSRPERTARGWECRVGMTTGRYAPYNHRTESSRYAYYLEKTGLRNGAKYPFLAPAGHTVARESAAELAAAALRRIDWTASA